MPLKLTCVIIARARKLDGPISQLQCMLQLFPRSDPRRCLTLYLSGWGRLERYKLSSQNEDIHGSILHLTEAVLLLSPTSSKFGVNITKIMFRLASALIEHSDESNQPDHANSSVKYLLCLRSQALEQSSILPTDVTTSLIEALAVRADLGFGNGMQDIKDMVALCDELFTLDASDDLAFRAAIALRRAIFAFGDENTPVLDQCINILRETSIRWPDPPTFSFALAFSLVLRFGETFTDVDFEEATTILNGIHGFPRPGDSLDRWQHVSLSATIMLSNTRSMIYEKPEYAEETISHFRTYLRSPLLRDASRPQGIDLLERARDLRFRSFNVIESSTLQEALSLKPQPPKILRPFPPLYLNVPPEDIARLRSVKAPYSVKEVDADIRSLHERLLKIPLGTSDYRKCLKRLVKSCCAKCFLTNDPTDIEQAISYCRSLLDSTPPGSISSCTAAIHLADLLRLAFEHTHEIGNLDESIGLLAGLLKVPAGQTLCNDVVEPLILCLIQRVESFCRRRDTDGLEALQARRETMYTIIEIRHLAVNNKYISVPSRLRHSCFLAQSLRHASKHGIGPSSLSIVYESALSLMQEAVAFAPNLQLQHTHLAAMHQGTQNLSLDYTSYLVQTHQLRKAIETLERGRALLWSELRGLHTPVQHVADVEPQLADRFTEINRNLEKLTVSVLPKRGREVNEDETNDGEEADPFGRLLMKQRKLLEERDHIISQIRSMPNLRNFLMTPSFDTLRSAASHGPVIIINHSEWRSDILILLYDSPPSLIPTSHGFYDDANKLKDDLVGARKNQELDSMEFDRVLAIVLEELYNLVGRSVVDKLHELNIQEQSRVWWCPTSAFCYLPLHAMGPIPSNDGEKRYFSDLYIPSYTPTLSSLIESRNPGTEFQLPRKPSLLLVAQPDRSLPGVRGEINVIQRLDIEVESLILTDATTAAVIEGLKHHKLVHFACHGNLEIGKPFDASFKLHGGKQLKLLDIAHSRLPNAEFAFLSACHTAEITEESIADEGLHLTGALQYCGFRSVVGTMWAMADTDGRDLVRYFYHSMLSGNGEGPYYLRSAESLRDAVTRLRTTRGVALERWVNFVHYGA